MAKHTKKDLRNQVMYSVFVRNHSAEGTFEGVRRDLDRIQALGVDVLWLLPVHPIGETARKGVLGCPYAIRDYRAVNPEYGTMDRAGLRPSRVVLPQAGRRLWEQGGRVA